MSKGKYSCIFSRKKRAIEFIIFQIFIRNTRGFKNWGISLAYSAILLGKYLVT